MIPQSFIDDLLSRADVVAVIDRYVPLKKAGINYAACCPFHQEKSPSFTVSPSKQFYHCFGCGAHGDALRFLMEYLGLGFVDAVKQLASDFGMTVPDERDDKAAAAPVINPLLNVLGEATRYYRDRLKGSQAAITYLKGRGLTGEIAARFGLGYAPDDWQGLASVFTDYASREDLATVGLVIDNEEKGRRYDRFRDRVMFPIADGKGRVIGFGGRVLGKGEPKYLNSPETPLFEKGRELYGLYHARQAIKEAGRVMVVEGYMDVVALAQFGVGYAVATLGTSTTADHLHKLMKQSDQIVFCFDGDNAGRKAAWRALNQALPVVNDTVRLDFLFLPEGEDPDTLVRQIGRDGFEQLMQREALPMSRFLERELIQRHGLDSAEGKARFWAEAKPLLDQVTAPALKDALRTQLRETAGLFQPRPKFQSREKGKWDGKGRKPEAPYQGPRSVPIGLDEKVQLMLLRWPPLLGLLPQDRADVLSELGDAARALIEFLGRLPSLKEASAGEALIPQLPERWRGHWTQLLKRAEPSAYSDSDNEVLKEDFKSAWAEVVRTATVGRRTARIDELQARWNSLSEDERRELQTLLRENMAGSMRTGQR